MSHGLTTCAGGSLSLGFRPLWFNQTLTDPPPPPLYLSYSIARARAAMLSSMSSEGRMSFSYVKQKSEDSPKVSVNLRDAQTLFSKRTQAHLDGARLLLWPLYF